MSAKKVCVVGAGNWGSAIAKLIGENVVSRDKFENQVNLYIYDEVVNGRNLSEIINSDHENVKYLSGIKLPHNVVAIPDMKKAVTDVDMLIIVVPHQFVKSVCKAMVGALKEGAIALSLSKGLDHSERGIRPISRLMKEILGIDISVMMGANLAREVAEGMFAESTIGCTSWRNASLFRDLIENEDFKIRIVEDMETVDLCGALKNTIASAVGICDGLGFGDNTRSAVIRLGILEMMKFTKMILETEPQTSIFFESCGVADVITTCYGGLNSKASEILIKTGKTIEQIELEDFGGQLVGGPITASQVFETLQNNGIDPGEYPVFVSVHRICCEKAPPSLFIEALRAHPEFN